MKKMLITGGAGFIGSNAAAHFSRQGWNVTILDDLSRRGSGANLAWLSQNTEIRFLQADVRDVAAVEVIVRESAPDVILHLAGQVAVTTSVADPRTDFEINAGGTFNMLEAARLCAPDSFFVNVSTNKVYGNMSGLAVTERRTRYEYQDASGILEDQLLDFHSPYGCSKGVGDQYTVDYHRIYGLRTVTLRQSCIYGPRQMGVEDQGWVAWFTIAAIFGRPVRIYGDGKQIRDVLYIDDLVRCYERTIENQPAAVGQVFNIGGGPRHTLSLRELIHILREKLDKQLLCEWSSWRPGDQRVFVCNIDKAKKLIGWEPSIDVGEGVGRLIDWVSQNRELFDWVERQAPVSDKYPSFRAVGCPADRPDV